MCNLGEGLAINYMKRGWEQGLSKGMKEGIERGLKLKYTPQNGHDKKKGSLKMDTRRRDKILVSGQ